MPERRTLIVDTDIHVRSLLGAVLRSRGILFDQACDSAEGLHRIAAMDYELIILEIAMPLGCCDIDLLESLHALQSGVLGERRSCPDVIVITRCTEDDLPTHAIVRHGRGRVRAVLRKPIDLTELSHFVTV